jgi:hypothetical protein
MIIESSYAEKNGSFNIFFRLMDVSVREDTKHAFFGEKWKVEISKKLDYPGCLADDR